MKVALVTTWGEKCGIAEYARNLTQNCLGVHFKIVPRPFDLSECIGCDIVHLNYEPGLFNGTYGAHTFMELQQRGFKTVMTLHTSHSGDNRPNTYLMGFDRVIVHEETTEGYVHIPHGIPIQRPRVPILAESVTVGTFGFPFPWKGFTEVVTACKHLGVRALVIAPESDHADTFGMKKHLESVYDNIEYYHKYMEQPEIIDLLGTCKAVAFAYHGGNFGVSGACRLGLASERPTVLTKSCRQFRDLVKYEDEIYFIERPEATLLATALEHALGTLPKRPKQVLKDMSWHKTAQMYREIYKGLSGG